MSSFIDETDRLTWVDVQAGYHRPPEGLQPATILDLGANTGWTLLDFRELFPDATIFGVEMDLDNVLHATERVAGDDRISTYHCAIGIENGAVKYDGNLPNNAYRIDGSDERYRGVLCRTLDSFVSGLPVIDFCKMDIEGMEKAVFRGPAEIWPERIRSLNVELHDYDVEEAQADLARLGYSSRTGPGTSLFAWR